MFPFHPSEGDAQILKGSVGWENEDEFEFQGDDDNDGYTLVRVQLFEGRDITQPLNPSRAQGHKIICHLSSSVLRTPPKDTLVYVAIPKGQENVNAAGVIIAAVEKRPSRIGNLKVDETCVPGPNGSTARVIWKSDGTVSLVSNAGNSEGGSTIAFSISPTGLKFVSPYGNFTFDSTGFHVKTKAGPRIDLGAVVIPGLPAEISGALTGYCYITAPSVKLNGNLVWLGVGTTWVTAVGAPLDSYSAPTPITSGPASQACSIRIALT